MINLIQNAIKMSEDRVCFINDDMEDIIQNALTLGEKERELVDTCGLRNIGKTYQLIEFAKKNGYGVLTNATYKLKTEHNYNDIYNAYDIDSLRGLKKKFVIDEISQLSFDMLKDKVFIITGYKPILNTNENITPLSIEENIKNTITNEIRLLGEKIAKYRDNNGDGGTYKNLILGYKELVNIYYNDICNKNNLINAINYIYNNSKKEEFKEAYNKTMEINKVLNDEWDALTRNIAVQSKLEDIVKQVIVEIEKKMKIAGLSRE